MNKIFSINVGEEIFWESIKTKKMLQKRKKKKMREGWKAEKTKMIMESLQRESSNIAG